MREIEEDLDENVKEMIERLETFRVEMTNANGLNATNIAIDRYMKQQATILQYLDAQKEEVQAAYEEQHEQQPQQQQQQQPASAVALLEQQHLEHQRLGKEHQKQQRKKQEQEVVS